MGHARTAGRLALAVPPSAPAAQADALRPPIVHRPIPFRARASARWPPTPSATTASTSARLRDPHVIVEHLTVNELDRGDLQHVRPRPPGPRAARAARRLLALRRRARRDDRTSSSRCRSCAATRRPELDGDRDRARRRPATLTSWATRRQLRASLRLTRWLRCRSGIKVRDVIGHNESLTSPYHREHVAAPAPPDPRRSRDARHAALPGDAPGPAVLGLTAWVPAAPSRYPAHDDGSPDSKPAF